jgi:hypothetical protein
MKRTLTLLAALSLLALGCVQRLHHTVTSPDAWNTVDRAAPFLKLHMRDGSLYVLSPWTVTEPDGLVTGTGPHYGSDRQVISTGTFSVARDEVVLFETNVARPSPSVASLALITSISAAVTVYCAANSKACFGSCPTFYVTDGERDLLQAEGFSASIAPRLEARDVDHLYRARSRGRDVRILMVNEAYETHVVRYVDLLAVRRQSNREVFQDHLGGFWHVTRPVAAAHCLAPEGDCSAAVVAFDAEERRSNADSTNLAVRETIELAFDATSEAPALVLAARQSLLPTYLLYQAFAYLGTSVGRWLAAFERGDKATLRSTGGLVETLGGIDILVPSSDGGWILMATISETGPLAADTRIVPLPVTKGPVRVRLNMAKGAWRLDWVALASIQERAKPLRIQPHEVLMDGVSTPGAHASLNSARDGLVTFPGDRYTIAYRLPDDAQQFELFLESRGYYLEWMREEWLAEEDPLRAAALFFDPAGSLKRIAPEFTRVEAQLDSAFWGSKYARH